MIENEPIINMVESLRKLQIGKHLDFSRCRPGGKCGSYFGVNVRHPLYSPCDLVCRNAFPFFCSKLKSIIKGTYFYDVYRVQDKNA